MSALFTTAREAFGPVDILVNNAAVYAFSLLTAITEDDYREQIDTNLWAPWPSPTSPSAAWARPTTTAR